MERIELRRQQKLTASIYTQPAVEQEKFAGTIPSDNESIEIGLTDEQRASFETKETAVEAIERSPNKTNYQATVGYR